MSEPIHTRTFKSGNSVAVRLPKALGIGPDADIVIERQGDRLVLRPAEKPEDVKAKLRELRARLDEIGPVGEIGEREPIEFPDRPGLY